MSNAVYLQTPGKKNKVIRNRASNQVKVIAMYHPLICMHAYILQLHRHLYIIPP